MGLSLQPEGPAAAPVSAAAALVKAAAGWLVTARLPGVPLRACQAGDVGGAGGCHAGPATAVGLQLGLTSRW